MSMFLWSGCSQIHRSYADDVLRAKTAGGSLKRLGFCVGMLAVEPLLNKGGTTIF